MKSGSVHAILAALHAAESRFLIVGGLAVVAHGYLRFTADIDLVIALDPENARRSLNALASLGYHPRMPVPMADFADATTRELWIREKGMVVFQLISELHPETPIDIFAQLPFDFDAELAQHAVLTNWVRKPDNVSFEVVGGLPVIVDTAVRALDEVGVKSGQTLLVSGAAGGIGSAVLQFARLRGITVIGTASAPKHDYLHDLGAIPTSYGPGLAERVRDLAPSGVDAALDLAGSGVIPELIEIVGDPSRVLSVADFSAEQYGAKFSHGPPKDPERIFADVARLCSEGLFCLRVDQTFPLEQTKKAQEISAAGHVTGKLIITIDD